VAVDGTHHEVGGVTAAALLVAVTVAWATWSTLQRAAGRADAAARLRLRASPAPAPVSEPRRRLRPASVVTTLPDAVDLLLVAARAGLPVAAAVGAVAPRAPPPWGPALLGVLDRADRGERVVDALDELVLVAGEAAHPLRSVLRAALDDGDDLVAGLDRLGADARDARRRRAEEAARRIPVRLLLPLVTCSLPAFALLSIVPILVGALGALDL
jgi:tight adherence protein C